MSFEMRYETWSKGEKAAARRAFDLALGRDLASLMEKVRRRARTIEEPDDLWKLHDFLSRERTRVDEKYDYRYSVLIFVFARLIKEGWLTETELEGLSEDKLARIRLLQEL